MTKKLVVASAVVVLTLALRTWLSAAPVVPPRVALEGFPRSIGEYRAALDHAITHDVAAVLLADDYVDRTYRSANGKEAEVFIAYYKAQKAGESMHSPKNCLPGSGWDPVLSDRITIHSADGPVIVNRYVTQNGPRKLLILYWYQSSGKVIASEYWGKFFLVWNAIKDRRRDGAIVRISVDLPQSVPVEETSAQAIDLAAKVLAVNRPFIP